MNGGRIFVVLGAASAALAVVLGAFGAHLLRARISPELLAAWQTGVQYQFYHALGLVLTGLAQAQRPRSVPVRVAGWLMLAGTALFSGSLYALALGGPRSLGALAPLGGGAFVLAWLALAWGALRGGGK